MILSSTVSGTVRQRVLGATSPTTIGILVVAAFILPAMMLISEVDWLENTLGAGTLIAGSALPGVLAAALVARAMSRVVKKLPFDAWVTIGIVALVCVGMTVALGSLSSRMLPRDFVEREFAVLGKEHYERGYRSPPEWFITVEYGGRAESLKVAPTTYEAVVIGGRYNVQVILGLWGHEIIPPPGRTCRKCPE